MQQKSRIIDSNQTGPHARLVETVQKHLNSTFQKPIADHTRKVFDEVYASAMKTGRLVIFDSCCGVGDSTRILARDHPEHFVIGIDKSESRVTRERKKPDPENMLLRRADLNDFYRLMDQENWTVDKHFILYPNPWPKAAHLSRRWHGSAILPSILKISKHLEMRSNWKLYLEEFQIALEVSGHSAHVTAFTPQEYLTPFEKKYHESGQELWQLLGKL